MVLYGGKIIERGPVDAVVERTASPVHRGSAPIDTRRTATRRRGAQSTRRTAATRSTRTHLRDALPVAYRPGIDEIDPPARAIDITHELRCHYEPRDLSRLFLADASPPGP